MLTKRREMPSANEIILAELMDGPRTSNQLLWTCISKIGHGAIIHSRVAELRSRGHHITCQRDDWNGQRTYTYTLEREQVAA